MTWNRNFLYNISNYIPLSELDLYCMGGHHSRITQNDIHGQLPTFVLLPCFCALQVHSLQQHAWTLYVCFHVCFNWLTGSALTQNCCLVLEVFICCLSICLTLIQQVLQASQQKNELWYNDGLEKVSEREWYNVKINMD